MRRILQTAILVTALAALLSGCHNIFHWHHGPPMKTPPGHSGNPGRGH